MPSESTTLRAALSRTYRRILPWALALAVATCSDDQNGPSRGGVGYFAFKPVYGVSNSLSQFGVVADSVHVLLTRPVNQVVLDTTVFFAPDSAALHLALPVQLESSPESLTAVIEISAGGTIIFVDSVDVEVTDGPPSPGNIPTVILTYVGPGKNVAAITVAPGDTTIFLGDTLFFSATAIDSSDAPVASFYTAWKTSDTTVAKINAQGRLIAPNLRGNVQVIGYTPTGIADTTLVTFAPVPVIITADSGTAQSGLAGDSLAALFVARVKGADSLGISGIGVRFTAVTAGGAVRDTFTLVTDAAGRVRTRGVLGTATGAYNYTATVVGTAISRTFSATATAGAPTAIAIQSGNLQVDSAGRALALPFTVRVADAFNNPTSGAKVYWLRTVGTGTLALDSSLTNGAGLATTGYTLGAVGVDSVTATLAGTSAFVAFQATAISGAAATVSKFFGDLQTDTVGQLLADSMIVTVRSATTQPVVGATVTWSVVRGGTTSSATTTTDAAGQSAVAYTLGTLVGVDSVKAQVGTASATFTATAVNAAAAAIAIASGDAQTDSAGRALPLPLVVRVTDAFSNTVSGAKVFWTRPVGTGVRSADSSFTDAAGLASITYTLGATGVDSVQAALAGTAATATFTLTTVNGAPATIVTIQGDSQTIQPNTTADTFAVRVRDAANQPVVGQKVDWSFIPAVGNFTPLLPAGGLSSFTDSLGVARGIYQSTNSAVTLRVEASIGSQLIDSIYVFIVPAAPSIILSYSGTPQVDTTGHPLPLPFVARVTDAFNNPVSGAKVYWTRVAGGGLLSADSSFTDGSGFTSVNYTLGAAPGSDTVTATIAGTGTFATFTAIALSTAPASIQAFNGDLQGDSAGKTIAPLVALVRDAASNPIVGTPVIWTVVRGGSLSTDTVITDAFGLAQVTYTLGTVAGIDSVRAQAGGVSVIFTEAVTNAAATTIAIQSGNNQTDTLGHAIALPFVVRVADAFNNPVSGSKVAFTRVAGSGSLFADTLTTDASGLATVGYLFGLVPGVDSIRADLVGTAASVNFLATAVPGVAATLQPIIGDNQVDTALATLATPMTVQVLDAQGRQVPGAIVAFAGTGGLTPSQALDTADLNGHVSVGITLGDTVGNWSMTATVVAVPAVQATFHYTTNPGAAKLIAIVSGDGQTDTTGKALALPLTAHVTDASGNDVAGAPVIFTVTAGGGSLAGDTVLTSAAGLASIGYTLGAAPGTNTVHAVLGGTSAFVDFSAFAVNALPASISPVSGSGQSAAVTTAFTDSLDVVVKDAGNAPIVNGRVIWTVSGVLTLSTDTTFTDSLGHASVRVTAGTIAGTYGVQATATGLGGPATFSLTVTAGAPATVAIFGGDGQSDTTGRTLAAPLLTRVTDAFGNNAAGAAVLFTVRHGAGVLSDDTVFTDVNGQAAVNYTLGGVPDVDTLRATLLANATFVDFTATALSAAPASIVATSGDAQNGTVGTALPAALVVTVKDAGNSPVVGAGVVWTALNGGTLSVDTVFTDINGQASANYTLATLAGTDSVQATTLIGAHVATFTAAGSAAAASQIAVQSGDGQVDTTGRTLPTPFTAVVYDAYNNPVAGQTVLFSIITGTGSFSVDSVVTDASGFASTTYTLGTTPGLEDLRATLKGTSAFIDFFATTVSGAPALIAKILGDAQTDTVLSALTDSLVVELRDAASTPIPAHWIYWQTAGATLSADSTLTGPDGRAAVKVTFDSIAIPIVVLARNVDTTLGAVFSLRATAGAPAKITEVTGSGQTGAINDTLPIDFRVLLQDAHNNPAQAGVAVTWTNLVGFQPAGLPDTTLTDTTGIATLIKPLLSGFVGEDSLVARILGRPDSVIFTATTNAGAATSLVYVSGTGQTDTVGRSLSAPMVVQLRDAASNPVAGAWVHWTMISGGGAVPLDSTQTDLTGAASSSLTMGTVAGLDSVRATFAGVTDTVVFYAAAENDVAAAIAIISGDGQSANVGNAVPVSVVAQVSDQYGNGVDGVTVTFTPSGLAGSVANPSITTDASGQASSGSWTLDTLAGTNTLLAAAGALNATAGAFALPLGTTKFWNGLTSTDWNTGANWTPVGVPTGTDNVFIPVSQPAPVLSADGAANDLTLQGGGTLDYGTNTLTINGSLFEGGATMTGGGTVLLAGSGAVDQMNVGVIHVAGAYALTSGAVGQVSYLQIDPTGTLDLNGHALLVNGNLRQDGTLVMKAGGDSLDVAGNLDVTSAQTGAGNLTNGTMVLRGGFTQEVSVAGFQATGNHTTVFVGAGQNISFQYPDSTNDGSGSYFNNVRFTDSTNFATSAAFRGTVTVDTGKKVTSAAGTTAGLNAALIGDVYADWSFNNTRFWATPASLPDSLRGSLEFFNTGLALSKPLAVGGALRISDNSNIDLNGHWVRVDSAFYTSGTGQFGMTQAGDSLDIAGLATLDGGPGSFQAGILVLRSDLSVPGASAVFQALGAHVTRFAGTVAQQVAFASPSLATNRFNIVEFDNPFGVIFNSDAAVEKRAEVKQGSVVGAGTITISGDLIDTTNISWRPEFTVRASGSGLLPARLTRNLELHDTLTLAGPFSVGSSLTLMGNAYVDVNGQTLTVDSNLVLFGGSALLQMTNATDSVYVGFSTAFDGGDETGHLTKGVLTLAGDLTANQATPTFVASGTHRTMLVGTTHTVSFPLSSGWAGNHFQDLEIPSGASVINALTDLYVNGTFKKAAGPTGTVQAPSQVQLQAHGLAVDNLNFDHVRVVYSGAPTLQFDNVNFLTEDSTLAQLQLDLPGGQPTLNNTSFQVKPSTGYYVAVADTEANESFALVNMYRSQPLDGTAHELEIPGNDGATINWSRMVFATQPTDAAAGNILPLFRVAVLNPAGDTATWYGNAVTLGIGAGPAGAAIAGTNPVTAVAGIATFSDIAIDSAGFNYTLNASDAVGGIGPVSSLPFNMTIPAPVGFDAVWYGTGNNDWSQPGNWSTGIVPDSATSVFIPAGTPNAPQILGGSDSVKKIRVAPGATLDINGGATLTTLSDIEAFGAITGTGTLLPADSGTITGNISSQAIIFGTMAVKGTASFSFNLAIGGSIGGSLTVNADTLNVTGLLQTVNDGLLNMVSPDAVVDVTGPAQFNGGSSTLTGGTFRVSGDLSTGGEHGNSFAPTAAHLTLLNGSATQQVTFAFADSASGSHFGRLQVGTNGLAFFNGHYDALGDLIITSGATLADSAGSGFTEHGFTQVDAGATLQVSTLSLGGGLGVAVGATYAVGNTVYYGSGLPVNPAPYDTLSIENLATASGDLLVTGDLRINGFRGPARFDVGGHTVTVNGAVNINGDGALVEQNPADQLNVAGDFFTNGASTIGLLTAGTLQIGGNFRQAGDGSGAAFWATAGHTTRFTGGLGSHSIKFDNRAFGAADSNNSKFGDLDLADGLDSVSQSGILAESVSIGGKVEYDTVYGGDITALGAVTLAATADTIHLQALNTYAGINVVGSPTWQVNTTGFFGGTTIPSLAYNNVLIAGPTISLTSDLSIGGNLIMGVYNEVGPDLGGDIAINGHVLNVGGLFTSGLGVFSMAPGDSVVDNGSLNFQGGNTAGHLVGGTLVVRGNFSVGNTGGDSAFVASGTHTTVLEAPGASSFISNALTDDGTQFGYLLSLDGGVRSITGSRRITADSITLGSATSGLNYVYAVLRSRGPVFTVAGSDLTVGELRVGGVLNALGSYTVANTIFEGTAQNVPALVYQNVTVEGTAALTDSLVLPNGNVLTIGGGAGAADLALGGHILRTSFLSTTGLGTLTMTNALDTVDVRQSADFSGGNESGKITAGAFLIHGTFNQGNGNSDSSFVATGSNEVRFTDSTVAVTATVASMFAGASRFNDVVITGTGVAFTGQVWVGRNIGILSPTVQPVTGGTVTIGGSLTDAGPIAYLWNVDTTLFLSRNTFLPDSMNKTVILAGGDTLRNILRMAGELVIQDTVVVNGYTIQAHNALSVTGPGLLQMTNPTDDVTIDGTATFNGAPSSGFMTAGRLTLNGNFVSGMVTPGVFDATGSHVTVFGGAATQSITFGAGLPRGAFNDVVTYNPDLFLPLGLEAHGTFRDSVTSGTLTLTGSNNPLVATHVEMMGVQLTDLPIEMGEGSQFDTANVTFADPSAVTQVLVRGAGSATPTDLHAVTFNDWATAAQLVRTVDTVSNGLGVNVRMFGTTPFDGSSKTVLFDPADPGLSSVLWSHLALASALPATIDSLVPFGFSIVVKEPDGSNRADVIGSADLSLVNGGTATLNGTTTANFDGQSASYFGLTLSGAATGASFHLQMQGRAIDSLNTSTFDVLNPAPAGAIAWDGGAGDGLWSSPANWSGDFVPAKTDSVFIPGGVSATLDQPNDTIGTLVLGTGAALNLGGNTLVSTGNVYAGQTITSGTLEIAGGFSQISGTLPTLHVTGKASAVGRTSIAGDLIIDGAAAEFNVGGQFVDVSNTLFTQNGGLLTMDGAGDSLYVSSVSFSGGDETGRLTDGLLLIQGANFDQGFGDPNSFHASGNHLTIFGSGGGPTAVNITNPYASQFAHVKVQNPSTVDFNESGQGYVRMTGDLTVSATGIVTGDTIRVDGTTTVAAPGDSIGNTVLEVGGALNVNGGFGVYATMFVGTDQVIPALPYQSLILADTTATLGANVDAARVFTQSGLLQLGGFTLHAHYFWTQGTGRLVMNSPEDTVLADTAAYLQGGAEKGFLTAGTVLLGGDLTAVTNFTSSTLAADPGHTVRFVGPSSHNLSISSPVYCEGGPCTIDPIRFGTMVVDTGSLSINDPNGLGVNVGDTLRLNSGALFGSASSVVAHGPVVADEPSFVKLGYLYVHDSVAVAVNDTAFQVNNTVYAGFGQRVTPLPYQNLIFDGSATALQARTAAAYVTMLQGGELTMAGHTLVVDSNFIARDSSHLVMADHYDSLLVGGRATFKALNTTGDFTAGIIQAHYFLQQNGLAGSDLGFVQTDSNRIAPMPGDTIEMQSAGPASSRLGFLDLSGTGGLVTLGDLWVTDSFVNTNPATQTQTLTGTDVLTVFGSVRWAAGLLHLDTLAVGGTLTVDSLASTYQVYQTSFIGGGQVIPADVPYNNVEVDSTATLGADLYLGWPIAGGAMNVRNNGDLDLGGHLLFTRAFGTSGLGVLTMTHATDSLVAWNVLMAGGNTAGHLTAGVIQASDFRQLSGASDSSYAPSGTHAFDLIDEFNLSETGPRIQTATAEFNTLRILATGTNVNDRPKLFNNLTVRDSFVVDGNIDQFVTAAVHVRGPVVYGPGANGYLNGLSLEDTLIIDPTANFATGVVFLAGAKTIPAGHVFGGIAIEGAQTLGDSLVAYSVDVRQGGSLTPNGHKVLVNTNFDLQTNARLVMAVGDTLDAGSASFDGAGSGTDLAGGLLRLRNGLSSGNSTSSQSFAPTGMVTEFYGGGTANINILVASPSNSFIDTLRVIEGTTIAPSPDLLVMGPATFKDGSTFNGNSASGALDFRGKVAVLDTSSITSGSTVFFSDSLTMATPGNYSVASTRFEATHGIPDLPYQGLIIDSVQMTLTHPITASGQMIITGGSPGVTRITLGGNSIRAQTLDISGYATVKMNDPLDSLIATSDMTFAGEDESGFLTAGTIRVGADLHQNGFFSSKSLRVDGARVEFYGASNHYLSFTDPDTASSYLGNVTVLPGNNLITTTRTSFMGRVDVGAGSTLDLGTLTAAQADFFGPVTVATGGSLVNSNTGGVGFRDTLLVAPTATYSVQFTSFYEIDTIPNLPYAHLSLGDGTVIALSEDLSLTGNLSLFASAPGGQDLDLNGHKIFAGGTVQTEGYGVISMHSPLDTLRMNGNMQFWGGNEAGRLTDGVIDVGSDFSQQATSSDKSFRSTGTLVRFWQNGTQQVSFETPDSSYFADVADYPGEVLQLNINGRMKATGTVGNYGTAITGDSLEVGVLSAGPASGSVNLTWLKAGLISGSFGTFNVGETVLAGSGVLPTGNFGAVTLSGAYTIPSIGGTITGSLRIASGGSLTGGDNAATLAVTSDIIADGGLLDLNGDFVSTGGDFTTQNGGLLNSTTAGGTLTVQGNTNFNGGNEIGHLTAGGIVAKGDFSIFTAGPTFRADSLFSVNFTGGGHHNLNMDIVAPGQYFGELKVSSSLPKSDTLNLTFAGELGAYKLSSIGNSVFAASGNGVQAERLAVNGATFDQFLVHVYTLTDQPEAFDNATFSGFFANSVQMMFEHPSHSGAFTFNGIDFDNNTTLPNGRFLITNRTDASGSFTINMGAPFDFSSGPSLTLLGTPAGSTIVNWASGF